MASERSFYQGGNLWKWAEAKVWQIDYVQNFYCVLMILCLFTECGESHALMRSRWWQPVLRTPYGILLSF
jgi:hypothetical protein